MSLYKGLQSKLFDTRMLEWNLSNGKITKDEYERHLSSLPDEEDKADSISVFSASEGSNDTAVESDNLDTNILQ